MGNRKAATAEIIKWMEKLLPGGGMGAIYEHSLSTLSDEQFELLMANLESGETILPLIAPNLQENKLSIERNFKIAEELGHQFFEHLWLTDAATGTVYLTPKKYLVIDLPIRRQQQMLTEKISIPSNNRSIDDLTGQVAGDSKSSSATFPEIQVLYSQGFDAAIEELIKFRGGDLKGLQIMNRRIVETGGVSLKSIKDTTKTRVKSTKTLSAMLTSMHLKNNL